MLEIWPLVPLPFLIPVWTSESSRFMYCWSLAWRSLIITLLVWKKNESEVAQSCPTLWDPVDCSPPGSSVHGILQARTLEWVAIYFSKRNYSKKESEVTHLCQTLCDPMDYSLPGSSIHGIFQARVLEWVATGAGKTGIYRAGWHSVDSDNQRTVVLISHASSVMLKILQARLQQ